MDPIEKLLSDLAPARSPAGLDQAMARMFDRAERKARVRRGVVSLGAMAAMLAIGLAAGYRLGANATPPASVTYIVPMTSDAAGFFDGPAPARASITKSPGRSGSMAITIVGKGNV